MARAVVRRLLVAGVAAGVVACGLVAGIDDYQIGDCKGGHCEPDGNVVDVFTSQTDAPGSDVDGGFNCTGVQNPPSIRIGPDENTFCIDSTEVTNGAYKAFLAANVPLATQPASCQWNTSFAPSYDGDAAAPADALPVVQIDWCDALAYCAWAGKYLCGKYENGHKTGPVAVGDLSDFTTHQWLLACSGGGRFRYPYGGIFDPSKCNLSDYDAGALLEPGAATGCVGGFEGLNDMIGNAWEWFDGPCTAQPPGDGGIEAGPEADMCVIKGGSYLDTIGGNMDCEYSQGVVPRQFHGSNVGFRCCSD